MNLHFHSDQCKNWRCISNGIYRPPKNTIMTAILKGCSKPKCSKLATSKGPSEWRISKGTTGGHLGLQWSFAQILCNMTAPPCGHRMMTQKGTSRNRFLVLYTLQLFEALTPEGKPAQQVGGQYANVSCWRQWLVLMIQSRLFLLRDNNFIHFQI